MEIADVDTFNNWILPIIRPICLADPESLARYIVVLLKKNNPNGRNAVRSYCIQNLAIFIDVQKTSVEEFVDMVLDAVENKRYMSSTATESFKDNSRDKADSIRNDRRSGRVSSKRSRSRSPVSSSRTREHNSRKSGNRSDEDHRKRSSRSRHSRSRSRGPARSRSPRSKPARVIAGAAVEGAKEGSGSVKTVCPTFESQGYCLEGEKCSYEHPGFLQVEDKDIQAIAATYQQGMFNQDSSGSSSTPQKTADTMKNAHISPVLAQYLQLGFQQIAATAADSLQQAQQFLQHDPNNLFGGQYAQQSLLPNEYQQNVGSVPVVVGAGGGRGFYHHRGRPYNQTDFSYSGFRGGRRNDFGVGGGGVGGYRGRGGHYRKFESERDDNLTASQLDNEMEEIAQANAAARLSDAGIENPSRESENFEEPHSGNGRGRGFRGSFRGGTGRGFRGLNPRGGRPGRGGTSTSGNRSKLDQNVSLEIRKIPSNLNSIGPLHEHFSAFGPVVNIQINHDGDPEAALVTFANHADAQSAYRSPNPLFNNRFIRMFWHHKEMQQQPISQADGNNQQKPIDEVTKTGEITQLPTQATAPGETPPKPAPPPRAKLRIDHIGEEKAKMTEAQNDLAKRRRLLLANYVEMRKSLSEKLQAAATDAVKTEITTTMKTIDEKIQALKVELGLAKSEQRAKALALQNNETDGQKPGGRAAMIVDRRPKQLLVSAGIPGIDIASLRSHFSLFCNVDGVELSSSGFIITFASRRDAEMAKARGLTIRGQQIGMDWHQPTFIQQPLVNLQSEPSLTGEKHSSSGECVNNEKRNTDEKTLFDDGDSEEEARQNSEAIS